MTTDKTELRDGFAACNGYVPAAPTDDCDGPAVPSNAQTPPAAPDAGPAAAADDPVVEDLPEEGDPIPFASTNTDTSETLAPPTIVENTDGTRTIELTTVAPGDDTAGDTNTVALIGTAEIGTWIPRSSFEVPGTDIVLVPADISAASTNTGGLEASVFGFEITVTADED